MLRTRALAIAKLSTIALACLILSGNVLVASAVTPQASTQTLHTLRFGLMSVNSDKERVILSVANDQDASQDFTLVLVDAAGKQLASKQGTAPAQGSLALTYRPSATTRVRGVVTLVTPAGINCNNVVPTLELDVQRSDGLHELDALDTYTHEDTSLP